MSECEKLRRILEKLYDLIPEQLWAELSDVEVEVAKLEDENMALRKLAQEPEEVLCAKCNKDITQCECLDGFHLADTQEQEDENAG